MLKQAISRERLKLSELAFGMFCNFRFNRR